jgi:UDP-glucose 4-epimerase
VRAIVTGAAGFIGSHVAENLLHRGWAVLGIDDLSGGFEANLPAGIDFRRLSITDPLDDAFGSFRPDFVYHLAAYAAEGLSHHIPVFNCRNNIEGTANVLAAARRAGARHFVFTSSIAAYGHPREARSFSEQDACDPCDPYGIAKLACELHLRAFREYFGGPDYTIFRPHNVYGPRQNISDPYRNVVGIFMRRALAGEPFPVFGDGLQTRSFSEVSRVSAAIAAAPLVPTAANEAFNIGDDEPTSVRRLAELVAAAMNVELRIEGLPGRREVLHAHASHAKLYRVFDGQLSPRVSLEHGLARMATHVRAAAVPPATPCPATIEIRERLPPSWEGVGSAREADRRPVS